jgi:hypothetical protein
VTPLGDRRTEGAAGWREGPAVTLSQHFELTNAAEVMTRLEIKVPRAPTSKSPAVFPRIAASEV